METVFAVEFTEAEKAHLAGEGYVPLETKWDPLAFVHYASERRGCGCCSDGIRKIITKYSDGTFHIERHHDSEPSQTIEEVTLTGALDAL